jgi:hypothetical protein
MFAECSRFITYIQELYATSLASRKTAVKVTSYMSIFKPAHPKHANMVKKDKKHDSDTESVTNGITKMKVSVVRNIPWVNSDDFSEKKLSLGDEEESGGISRVNLMYKYDKSGEQTLYMTLPRDSDAFMRSNGVEEETYAKKNGQRTGTGKNIMKFYMDVGNEHHERFYDCLSRACGAVKKKIEKHSSAKVDVRIRGLYNILDDDKNVTGHAISARLIESNNGIVYTSAYNDEEHVDVKDIGRCVARPAFIFSYTIPEDKETYRINVSLAQIYYKSESLFPLRDRD